MRNTPKKSMGKAKKREKKEEKSAIETEKEIRQQSKQKVAGWLIDHGFQLSQKNVPGFLAFELFRALHAYVTNANLQGVQEGIKQGGNAIGDILNFQLGSGTTLSDIADLLASEEKPSFQKKGEKQKWQPANRKNSTLTAAIEIKNLLEAAVTKGNSNPQGTNISENSENSENMGKESSDNEGLLEQNRKNNAKSTIKSNKKTDTVKETPKSEEKIQTGEIETKIDKETELHNPQAEPKETTQTKSKTSEKRTTQGVLPEKQQRRQEKKKKKEQAKLEKERQEQQKVLEKQKKSNKVEKPEAVKKVEQTKTGEAEKIESMEKTQKPAEQKDQKIEKTSKNFQRNKLIPKKQGLPRSPSWNFEDVNKGERKSIENIMGTKNDKESQTLDLEPLQSPNATFDKRTQTPRAWQQIHRVNPPRLQFFHDEKQNVSVDPTPPKNKNSLMSPKDSTVSILPDTWECKKLWDEENYRVFEEESKKSNPNLTLTTNNEQNILHYYARFGKIGEIENLYATHSDTFKQLLNSPDNGGWTPLHLAVKYGGFSTVKLLELKHFKTKYNFMFFHRYCIILRVLLD